MACDVFEEKPFEGWPKFSGDTGDVGPQVAGVVLAKPLSCHAERLAWVSGNEGVDCPGKGSGVKCGKVVPDRGRGEVSGPLGGNDCASGIFLPLDKATGVESGFGKHEAHIKATGSCAEGNSVSGTGQKTHVMPPPAHLPEFFPWRSYQNPLPRIFTVKPAETWFGPHIVAVPNKPRIALWW